MIPTIPGKSECHLLALLSGAWPYRVYCREMDVSPLRDAGGSVVSPVRQPAVCMDSACVPVESTRRHLGSLRDAGNRIPTGGGSAGHRLIEHIRFKNTSPKEK